MNEFKIEFNWDEFFELLEKMFENKDISEIMVRKFGGIYNILNIVIPEFENIPVNTKSKNDIYLIGELIFSTLGSDTYKEDWDNYGYILRKLPIRYFFILISNWCPKRRCDNTGESVLLYLLNRYYEKDLDTEIYNILKPIYDEVEGEGNYPEQFEVFQLREHYKDELITFVDLNFLNENRSRAVFETNEIKSLFCQVIIGNKLDSINKLKTFCELVDYFAPSNQFDRKYRDAFIMEIFESIQANGEEWEEEEYLVWKEEFYNIDFDWSCEDLTCQIKDSVKNESDHISKMLKINPNYRHD